MKKLLILLASCMPIGTAAALLEYQAPVLKNDYYAKDFLKEKIRPISINLNGDGYLGYTEPNNYCYLAHTKEGQTTFEGHHEFVENTHGIYYVRYLQKNPSHKTLAALSSTDEWTLIFPDKVFNLAHLTPFWKIGKKAYCFYTSYSDDGNPEHKCLSFAFPTKDSPKEIILEHEELVAFKTLLVPKSLAPQKALASNSKKVITHPLRMLASGGKTYFVDQLAGIWWEWVLYDDENEIKITSPHIALSHDESRIAYLISENGMISLAIADSRIEKCNSIKEHQRIPLKLPHPEKKKKDYWCYFDASGSVHVGPTEFRGEELVVALGPKKETIAGPQITLPKEEELVVAMEPKKEAMPAPQITLPKFAASYWRNWSVWRWAIPATAALVGLGALWKTKAWKKVFSR